MTIRPLLDVIKSWEHHVESFEAEKAVLLRPGDEVEIIGGAYLGTIASWNTYVGMFGEKEAQNVKERGRIPVWYHFAGAPSPTDVLGSAPIADLVVHKVKIEPPTTINQGHQSIHVDTTSSAKIAHLTIHLEDQQPKCPMCKIARKSKDHPEGICQTCLTLLKQLQGSRSKQSKQKTIKIGQRKITKPKVKIEPSEHRIKKTY